MEDLQDQFPEIKITPIRSLGSMIAGNCIYGLEYAIRKAMPWTDLRRFEWYFAMMRSTIPPLRRTIAREYDLVFAHEFFPINAEACPVPIVFQTKMSTAECLAAYGVGADYVKKEISLKRKWGRHAAKIVVPSPGDKELLCRHIPDFESKCVVIPPYVPWIEPIQTAQVVAKHVASDKLRVLFVGNESRRKGLDQVAAAWREMPAAITRRIEVTVVSRFIDGMPAIQDLPWSVRSDISQEELDTLMENSHVLLLPTYGDTFGVVLIEAMAAGCCVISSRRSPQDWILDFGRAGMLVDPLDAKSIAAALTRALLEPDMRSQLAVRGHKRFVEMFHHLATGAQYYRIFKETLLAGRRNK
jgi:glycosyltransferase involved in cell wall biosynthesis